MTPERRAHIELTSQEKFLLEWLSKEDFSHYGECEGVALNVLVKMGLAKVTHRERTGWALVSLTDAGWNKLKTITPTVTVGEA